jgi:TonB-linked SusC/RagA family outer membrane protein
MQCKVLYLLVVPMLIFASQSFAQEHKSVLDTREVSMSMTNATARVIFDTLTVRTGLYFTIIIDTSLRFDVHARKESLSAVLSRWLGSRGYTWKVNGNTVVFTEPLAPVSGRTPSSGQLYKNEAWPVRKAISGAVSDDAGQPLFGATVLIKGTANGAKTSISGEFTVFAPDTLSVLEVSFIGYETQQVKASANTAVTVRLKPSRHVLDEQLAIGYAKSSRRQTTAGMTHVKFTDMAGLAASNPLIALQGRVPGLPVTQTTGAAGGAINVELRGKNFLFSSSGPLYVINGVPWVAGYPIINLRPSIASQNVNGGISPFTSLIFGDIESIVVLKDAAATAIYGSRGANGVILITTVRGKPQGIRFSANVLRGAGQIAHRHRLLSTAEYLGIRREAHVNDKIVPGSGGNAPDLTQWDPLRYTDWQEQLIGRSAAISDANVALSMGNEQLQVRIGGSWYNETSVFVREMYYGRKGINLALDYKGFNDKFRLAVYTSYSSDHNHSFNGSLMAIATPPNAPDPYDGNGKLAWYDGVNNPVADLKRPYSIAKKCLLFNVTPQYMPLPDLSIKTIFGASGMSTDERDQTPIASQPSAPGENKTGTAAFAGASIRGFIAEPIIEYAPRFVVGHLNIIAGASYQYTATRTSTVIGEGYTDDALLMRMDKAVFFSKNTKIPTKYKYGAVFAQLNYQWQGKYIGDLSFRRDASSRFSPGLQAANFWSLASAWIFSEEPFFRQLRSFLHFGKIRASYGVTGSDQIGDNQFQDIWSPIQGSNPYQGIRGIAPEGPYNPAYSWERCVKMEAAIALEFLRGRLLTNVTYFRNKSDKQLMKYDVAGQTGFRSILGNFGAEVLNRGIEIVASADIIKSSKIQLHLAANLTFPKNELLRFPNLSMSSYNGRYLINEPITVLNKLQSEGVDAMTGLYKMNDQNKDSLYDVRDYRKIGALDPSWYGGVEVHLSWKNFRLHALGEYRKQMGPSYIYAALLSGLYPGGLSNQPRDVLDHWRQPGDQATYQKLSTLPAGEVYGNKSLVVSSSEAYTSSSFFKLRELSLSYTLHQSTLSRLKCRDAKVYLKAQNLLTVSDYNAGDPETMNFLSLSTLKVIAVGLQLSL